MLGRRKSKPTSVRDSERNTIEAASVNAQVRILVDQIRKNLDEIDELVHRDDYGTNGVGEAQRPV